MPNTPSAIKRVRQNERRNGVNQRIRSSVRTAVKQTRKAVEDGNLVQAAQLLLRAEREIASAAAKGVLNKKNASRKISRMAKLVAKAQKDNKSKK